MPIRFTKMHGIGNDYVYVDAFSQHVADPAALAVAVSDRHFGIGADGLILILPSRRADILMRMFNADGSESEMCGNGIRCVAKFAFEHNLSRANPMRIQSGSQILTLDLAVENDKVTRVTVDMGHPILDAEKIPTTLAPPGQHVIAADLPRELLNAIAAGPPGWAQKCGLEPAVTAVSMGNPHAVLYCNSVADVPLQTVGPLIERAAVFPRRINVHFVQVISPDNVTMRTWERGTGITLACGSGACAVNVAGVLTKKSAPKITATLPGGQLQLHWPDQQSVKMTGPATEVFSGEWPAA